MKNLNTYKLKLKLRILKSPFNKCFHYHSNIKQKGTSDEEIHLQSYGVALSGQP